ncbi:MAG: excalibur calcium-binding domain-containing protein [Paraglaciecola sp.]|nr:excalibur calcium-binding domain-containing protein [Paraglaciecola sp.]NCT48024.1 excalibur calcium-binding domain-containing protein [Paraglaciecola sp.]
MTKSLLNVCVLALLGFWLYQLFQPNSELVNSDRAKDTTSETWLSDESSSPVRDNNFVCDGRRYCSEMRSLDEAIFFIKNCPNTQMDGDGDGRPCENDSRFE